MEQGVLWQYISRKIGLRRKDQAKSNSRDEYEILGGGKDTIKYSIIGIQPERTTGGSLLEP